MYYFTPPTAAEHRAARGVFKYISTDQGVSVLKEGGSYRQVREPTSDEVAAADVAYIGGYVYEVNEDEASELILAGYEDFLAGPRGYGNAPYGIGPYGF